MGLQPDQNHSHSGMAGDGRKIRFQDLADAPSLGYYATIVTHTAAYGTVTVSGIGFKPSKASVTAVYSTAAGPATSHGRVTAAGSMCVSNAGGGDYDQSSTEAVLLRNGTGTAVKRFTGTLTDSGVTLVPTVSSGTCYLLIELS